jgi:hypothetical protein
MTDPDEERQPWELGGEAADSDAPANPTGEPISEDERGDLADDEPEGEEVSAPGDDEDEAPPERTHEDEGELGAGAQYAAEDAEGDHSDPRGPAGAA